MKIRIISNSVLNNITDLYLNKKLSIKQISEKLKIPTTTLHRKLKRSEIKLRTFEEGVRLFHLNNPGIWKGKKKPKLSKILKGHKIPKETRRKISISLKEVWQNDEIRQTFISGMLNYYKRHSNHRKGKKNSIETCKKISKTLRKLISIDKNKSKHSILLQ